MSKVKKHIEKIKPLKESYDAWVEIKTDKGYFFGESTCHKDDMEFCSPKIGYNIARLRAEAFALKAEYLEAKKEAKAYKQLYSCLMQGKDDIEVIDPTHKVRKLIFRSQNRVIKYKQEYLAKKEELRTYLQELDKAHTSMKSFREVHRRGKRAEVPGIIDEVAGKID